MVLENGILCHRQHKVLTSADCHEGHGTAKASIHRCARLLLEVVPPWLEPPQRSAFQSGDTWVL